MDIGKTQISATVIYMSGTKATVEQCLQEAIITNNELHYTQRVQETLKKLVQQLPKCDEVRSALPSSAIVFKKLKLPFTNYDKIKMVIGYEVEPLLPFSVDQAVIDFVITHTNQQEHSAEILVAAAQNKKIIDHLALFENTGIEPQTISVDLLALYGLYVQIEEYKTLQDAVALIDLGTHETRIAYIDNGILRFVRTLPKSIIELAKTVSTINKSTPQESLENMIRFGVAPGADFTEKKVLIETLKTFWNEINFTLTSFATQTQQAQVKHIFILGGGAQMKGLIEFVTDLLKIPCKHMQINQLFTNRSISSKKTSELANHCIMSTSIALPNAVTDQFNLRQKEFISHDARLIYKQLITSALLLVLLLGGLFLHSFWQMRKLSNEIQSSEREIISTIKQKFPQIPKEDKDLEDIINSAQQKLVEEEKVWFAFSGSARSSFLTYLLELFTRLDRQTLGLQVEQITIKGEILILKAEVKDHQALKILERDLRASPLFEYVEGQEDPKFTMRIRLAKTNKGH